MITSKQYAEKIVDVAYHEVLPNKETVCDIITALIDEYTKQEMKEAYEAGRLNPIKSESEILKEIMNEDVNPSKSRQEPKNFENWYLINQSVKSI